MQRETGAACSRAKQYLRGVKAGLPVILGFLPVGVAYAIMARQAGFSGGETVLMSLAVFAGASQMMAAGMYAQGAGLAAIILATFILNLRHLIMSACVVRRIREGGVGMKLLAAFGVTDETFAIFTTQREEACSLYNFLGLMSVAYAAWVAGSALGVAASGFLPPALSASLGIAMYAMFISILLPGLKGNLRLGLLVLFTACFNTALSQWMPSSWALIASTLFCALLGVFFVDPNKKEEGKR